MIQAASRIASAATTRMMRGKAGNAERLLFSTDPIRSEGQR